MLDAYQLPDPVKLVVAIDKNQPLQVAALLAKGSDPNACLKLQSGESITLLEYASRKDGGDVDLVGMLLAAGADARADPLSGWSFAREFRNDGLGASFCEEFARRFSMDHSTMLEEYRGIGRRQDEEDVSIFSESRPSCYGFLRGLADASGLLHAAAMVGDPEHICKLLFEDFDPNNEVEIDGLPGKIYSPLCLAFYSGSTARQHCIHLLLAGRADPFLPSSGMSLQGSPWTLLGAAEWRPEQGKESTVRRDDTVALHRLLQRVPRRCAIKEGKQAAEWLWRCINLHQAVTTRLVRTRVEYLLPRISLGDLVRAGLALWPSERREEEDLRKQLVDELLCLSTQYDNLEAVGLLIRAKANVNAHDTNKR